MIVWYHTSSETKKNKQLAPQAGNHLGVSWSSTKQASLFQIKLLKDSQVNFFGQKIVEETS